MQKPLLEPTPRQRLGPIYKFQGTYLTNYQQPLYQPQINSVQQKKIREDYQVNLKRKFNANPSKNLISKKTKNSNVTIDLTTDKEIDKIVETANRINNSENLFDSYQKNQVNANKENTSSPKEQNILKSLQNNSLTETNPLSFESNQQILDSSEISPQKLVESPHILNFYDMSSIDSDFSKPFDELYYENGFNIFEQ
jgi:hypothetical protein